MNFSPTTAERFAFSLRERLQRRVVKDGFLTKNIILLKKIHLFEAQNLWKNYFECADVFLFADTVLSRFFIIATAKGATVKTRISAFGNAALNYRGLSLLLGVLCKSAETNDSVELYVSSDDKTVNISVSGIKTNEEIKKAAALTGVTAFYETDKKKALFCFAQKASENQEKKTEFCRETEIFMLFAEDCL